MCWMSKWLVVGALAGASLAGPAAAGALDDIQKSNTLRLAFREDAPPFSYRAAAGEPAGFMVDLCRLVAENVARQIKKPGLKVTYVPVTSVNRFDVIAQGKADLLCEATTHTLSRREIVAFSIPTFFDGTSFVVGPRGSRNVNDLAGKKVGVLAGTTTEQNLRQMLKAAAIGAEVVVVKTHQDGMRQLASGGVAAYFADHSILMSLLAADRSLADLQLIDAFLSIEPFALAMRSGDEKFRLAVDRALSEIYRSGGIMPIFRRTFGDKIDPGAKLRALYTTAGLPD